MFLDDGCTFWPDGWGGVSWRACCDAHDFAFHTGETVADFLRANLELWWCVMQVDAVAATIMFAGVTSVGAIFFFVGLKKPKPRKDET